MLTTQAGAGDSPAPAPFVLRPPTFGDWVACGDIDKTYYIADPHAEAGVEATMEFAVDPESAAKWFLALSKKSRSEINGLSMAEGKALFALIKRQVPAFTTAIAEGAGIDASGAVVIDLAHPLPGARGKIAQVTLRPPLVGDWIMCGNPSVQRVSVDNEVMDGAAPRRLEQRIDRSAVNRWFMALSGLPEPILHLMHYSDAMRLFAYMRQMLAGLDEGN